jgi:hypothetical protein
MNIFITLLDNVNISRTSARNLSLKKGEISKQKQIFFTVALVDLLMDLFLLTFCQEHKVLYVSLIIRNEYFPLQYC